MLQSADNELAWPFSGALKRSDQGPRVLLCGYYGEHNLGDDALLEVLLGEIPPAWQPVVTAHDQRAVVREHAHVMTVARRSLPKTIQALFQCDVLVLGGGSLLQDSTSLKSLVYYLALIGLARLKGRPVILWGQGLGPLRRTISRVLVRGVLPFVQAIGWRDAASQALAERWNIRVPSLMAADPVWSYPARPWKGNRCDSSESSGLVLCWRPTDQLDSDGWASLLKAVCALAEQHNLRVTWLAFHQHQDQGLPSNLMDQALIPEVLTARSTFLVATSLEQVMDVFAHAQLVLAMRLHALILARLCGAPCGALSYDPKVAAAAAMAEVDCVDLEALPSSSELLDRWTAQLGQSVSMDGLARIAADASRHGDLLRQILQVG